MGTDPKVDSCYFYNDLSVYEGFGGAAIAIEEGEHIADALGPTNKCVILQNHGYVLPPPRLNRTFLFFFN
jgi:hypothetical protein